VQAHEAKAIVGLIQTYWPNQKLPDSTVMLWSKSLEQYSYEHAKAALDRHHDKIPNRDVIAVADFARPSRLPRYPAAPPPGRGFKLIASSGTR